MARSWPSLGLFGVFRRSEELRTLDRALQAADLHPALIPDAVKLTVLSLLKEAKGENLAAGDHDHAAALLCYCALGGGAFAAANGELAATAVERRIEAALEAGEGLDASLILLTLHAAVIHPGVKEAYQFESE